MRKLEILTAREIAELRRGYLALTPYERRGLLKKMAEFYGVGVTTVRRWMGLEKRP